MRVLIVDDEPSALKSMEKLLGQHAEIEIAASVLDPREALILCGQTRVDAVFLETVMSEIGGMELAARISSLQPDVHIIFVTACDQYAVQAFELHALDYLLKPVSDSRLAKTIERLRRASANLDRLSTPVLRYTQLGCLGTLHWRKESEEIRTFSWRTSKTQELFTFLLHQRRGPAIRKEAILDVLWPEQDPVRATVQLHTTVYQIRKMLKEQGLAIQVVYEQEGYRLQFNDIRVDADVWEQECAKLPVLNVASIQAYKQLLTMYKGDYFADSSFQWLEGERERLRLLQWQYLQKFAEFCLAQELLTEARDAYQQMKEQYPLVEAGYWGLMQVHLKLANYAEVKQQYDTLQARLDEELGIYPSLEIRAWLADVFEQRQLT